MQRVALIDGDMMLRKNMDELFDIPLAIDEIAATHACVCNLDKSSWAPESW
jgi:alpha-N-acetylglucosamine transferase